MVSCFFYWSICVSKDFNNKKKINCHGIEINLKEEPVLFIACVIGIVIAIVKCFVSFIVP